MFRYTNFSDDSSQPQKARLRSPNAALAPKRGIERPESRRGTSLKETTLSERYTNKTYDRLPSPRGRFQSLANAVNKRAAFAADKTSAVKEQQGKVSGKLGEKSQIPKPLPRSLPIKQSCSAIINKKTPVDEESNRDDNQSEVKVKVRPKTSTCSRTESHLEQKVLHTMKSVLSQALLKQGKIDETNIENVINNMRNSLKLDQDLDDEPSNVDIEVKPSRITTVGRSFSEVQSDEKKTKPIAGIVRRENVSSVPERKPYKKMYSQREASMGDDETLLCIELSNSVLNSHPATTKTSKRNIQMESKRNGLMKQFEVGDFQSKENRFWNPSEDAKLHEYIESLIHNMKNQVNCDNSMTETEGDIDSQGTFCRSFCVCKVCISKQNQSKTVLNQNSSRIEEPLLVKTEKLKPFVSSIQRPKQSEGSKTTVQSGAGRRLRLVRQSSKVTEAKATCKVITNTNPNFNPESSVNTSLHTASSYTVMNDGNNGANNLEEGEDLYLQRRIRKAPSRRTSAKIN